MQEDIKKILPIWGFVLLALFLIFGLFIQSDSRVYSKGDTKNFPSFGNKYKIDYTSSANSYTEFKKFIQDYYEKESQFNLDYNKFTYSKKPRKESQNLSISYVIDGDTFILENGEKVRYLGMDTPEIRGKGGEDDDCLAWWARLRNMELLSQGELRLERNSEVNRDPNGRLLRYVYIKPPQGEEIFLNSELVREGLARSFFCGPDQEKSCVPPADKLEPDLKKKIEQAENEAKRKKRGVFSNVNCGRDLIKNKN